MPGWLAAVLGAGGGGACLRSGMNMLPRNASAMSNIKDSRFQRLENITTDFGRGFCGS
jgi:hypothetical protein